MNAEFGLDFIDIAMMIYSLIRHVCDITSSPDFYARHFLLEMMILRRRL